MQTYQRSFKQERSRMKVYSFFWSDEFWLPKNITWQQIELEGNYPNPNVLLYSIPLAFALFILRVIIERKLILPIAIAFGLHNKKLEHNDVLEDERKTNNNISQTRIKQLSKTLNWPEIKIHSWIRKRNKMNKLSKKFAETGWRAAVYTFLFTCGLIIQWDKPWLRDVSECWTNRSSFVTPISLLCYYLMELALYESLLLTQFFDVKRKDFWQMFFHHIIAILLMLTVFFLNSLRIVFLLGLCHDVTDIPLEIAKIFRYLNMKRSCNTAFITFFIVWIVARLIIFPLVIIKSVWYESSKFFGPTLMWIFMALLFLLMSLNIMWTGMILRSMKSCVKGNQKDERSDSEDYSDN